MTATAKWLIGNAAAFGLLYLVGINRNLFYIMFAFTCVLLALAVVRSTRGRLAASAIFVGSAVISVSSPLPPRVDVQKGYKLGSRPLTAGQALQFKFDLTDIEKRRTECGAMKAEAIVVGVNLSAMDIQVDSAKPLNVDIQPLYERHLIRALLPGDVKGSVSLTLTPGDNVALYQGPEVSGRDAYPDAVYLLFTNSKCRVAYHARRSASN